MKGDERTNRKARTRPQTYELESKKNMICRKVAGGETKTRENLYKKKRRERVLSAPNCHIIGLGSCLWFSERSGGPPEPTVYVRRGKRVPL